MSQSVYDTSEIVVHAAQRYYFQQQLKHCAIQPPVIFIHLEQPTLGVTGINLPGLDVVIEYYQNHPDSTVPVVMLSHCSEVYLLQDHRYHAALRNPHACYYQLGGSLSGIVSLVERARVGLRPIDELAWDLLFVYEDIQASKLLERQLVQVEHCFNQMNVQRWCVQARRVLGFNETIPFSVMAAEARAKACAETGSCYKPFITQMFFDICVTEDALYTLSGELDVKLLAHLQEMSRHFPITILASFNLKNIRVGLCNAGVRWKVVSLHILEGVVVGQIISHLSEDQFMKMYNIRSASFVVKK